MKSEDAICCFQVANIMPYTMPGRVQVKYSSNTYTVFEFVFKITDTYFYNIK